MLAASHQGGGLSAPSVNIMIPAGSGSAGGGGGGMNNGGNLVPSATAAAAVVGMDDEIEFACPNCGVVIGASECRPISIGCIVRSAVRTEAMQRRALHCALSNDKSEIPPISQEAMGEIFTVSSSKYTNFPPILTSMKFTIPEIQQRKALMGKVVRTCHPCYERFVDDLEVRRQLKDEMARLKPRPQRPPQRLEPISLISSGKDADRRTDMAFTNLQVSQRTSSRVLQNKQTVREKLMHTIGGNTDALAIDWEVVPQMAIREMRRTANNLLIAEGGGSGSPAAAGPSPPPAHASGDVIFRRGRNTAPPPISYLGLGSSPVTAFDVPLEARLMADLFAKVSGACEEFATVEASPVPPTHPLHSVYRQNHNRLPAPPIPVVHSELPHPLECAPIATQRAIPSEVRALEDTPALAIDRSIVVGRAVSGLGWGSFTPAEMAMLADVMADATIVVESDEDEEDEEDESDYDDDDEGWRDDGMYYQ